MAYTGHIQSASGMEIDVYIGKEIVVTLSQQVELEVVIRVVEYCHTNLPEEHSL